MCYILWCNAPPTMLPAEGRQHRYIGIQDARCLKVNGNSHQCEATIHKFKSLVNDFVYSFGRAALLLLVEV